MRRKVGRVVEVVERYIRRCRKRGMERTTKAVTRTARGVGERREEKRFWESDEGISAV